jgi:methylenetetrahydrofolate reductase (NADPH)
VRRYWSVGAHRSMVIGHLESVVDRGPAWLASLFEGSDGNLELRGLLAVAIAAEQCRLLRTAGVEEFHFYTLNRAKLTLAICHILGIHAPLPARP